MRVFVLRHAQAGSKKLWTGDDKERPLAPRGVRQARDLAQDLATDPPARVLSSPHRRCLETVEPLCISSGVPVEVTDRLSPDDPSSAMALFFDLLSSTDGASALVCTHGEVTTEILRLLGKEEGLGIGLKPPNQKGGRWLFEGQVDSDIVHVTSARYFPPRS